MRLRHTVLKFSTALVVVGVTAGASIGQGAEPGIWQGVYTDSQADRGVKAFEAHGCTVCHGADMNGTGFGPSLIGEGFPTTWRDKSLGEFVKWARENMPPGDPGSLPLKDDLDIVAAILRANSFPAGSSTELTAASADTIKVTPQE